MMHPDPLFMWGLAFAILMLLFYIGVALFMLVVVLRDYVKRRK